MAITDEIESKVNKALEVYDEEMYDFLCYVFDSLISEKYNKYHSPKIRIRHIDIPQRLIVEFIAELMHVRTTLIWDDAYYRDWYFIKQMKKYADSLGVYSYIRYDMIGDPMLYVDISKPLKQNDNLFKKFKRFLHRRNPTLLIDVDVF